MTETNGWNVKCNVRLIEYSVDRREGDMLLPENNLPDMKSTIACFKSIDPEVQRIYVTTDGVAEVLLYALSTKTGEWISGYAYPYRKEERNGNA